MSTYSEVEKGVYRWDGVDADHGFPIVGYVVSTSDGSVLVDPPGTSGTAEEISALGEPRGILLTSRWHVRGAGKWKDAFGIPIAAPASAEGELAEAHATADRTLDEGDEYLGWRVLRFTVQMGDQLYDELAFWNVESRIAIIGDLITEKESGGLGFGPHLFSNIPVVDLQPFVQRLIDLQPRLLLSSHIGPRQDAAEVLQTLALS